MRVTLMGTRGQRGKLRGDGPRGLGVKRGIMGGGGSVGWGREEQKKW